ncbi:MAG: glycine cleavage system aminomethyltransferase GcvT [Phycisphaerales bacterium]
MLRTPLHNWHIENKGQMVEFAGWEMPIRYSGINEEHAQVRSSGGMFDVSHMGRFKISGRHARKLLERVCTRKIFDMENGQCRYSLVCNEQGGVRDDVIVYRMDDDDFLVVVNASNREKLLAHFKQVQSDSSLTVNIVDQTADTAMVALQGPKIIDLISRFSSTIPTMKKYRFMVKNLMIIKLIVSRTGYTGEDGVEVILPAGSVKTVMSLLFSNINMSAPDAIIKPIGLGARDTLRMEAAMPLYGHELGEDICALSCGVDFAISMDKDASERGEKFIGMDALRKIQAEGGPKRKLAGFLIDGKRSARQGMVIRSGGREVGVVTSGCPSPTLGTCIAMGFLDTELHAPGTELQIDTGKESVLAAKVHPLPFYKLKKS